MRRLGGLVLLGLICVGCAESAWNAPPRIRYGEDVCRWCRMSIDDARFAAALVDERGLPQRFDDIGCMSAYRGDAPLPSRAWVRDYSGGAWIEASRAVFVASPSLATPMGSGIAAFSDTEAAEKFSSEAQGRLIAWQEMGGIVLEHQSLKKKEAEP